MIGCVCLNFQLNGMCLFGDNFLDHDDVAIEGCECAVCTLHLVEL